MAPFRAGGRAVDGERPAPRAHGSAPGAAGERARAGAPSERVSEVQRRRILMAMVQVACERGAQDASVAHVVERAGVSRRTFYELFDDRSDCLQAAFEDALARTAEPVCAAYEREQRWVDRVRAGLLALLRFFDEEPELAQLCVVQAPAGGPAMLARRAEVLGGLERVLAEGEAQGNSRQTLPLTAQGVLGGVLGVIHAELVSTSPRRPLAELLNPLMSMIVLPYLGAGAARRELARRSLGAARSPRPAAHRNPLEGLEMRLTYRTLKVLAVVAGEPGISNRTVGTRAGILDQGQISKLLTRLQRLGLIENQGEGPARGGANAWRLTRRGGEVEQTLRLESTLNAS